MCRTQGVGVDQLELKHTPECSVTQDRRVLQGDCAKLGQPRLMINTLWPFSQMLSQVLCAD